MLKICKNYIILEFAIRFNQLKLQYPESVIKLPVSIS